MSRKMTKSELFSGLRSGDQAALEWVSDTCRIIRDTLCWEAKQGAVPAAYPDPSVSFGADLLRKLAEEVASRGSGQIFFLGRDGRQWTAGQFAAEVGRDATLAREYSDAFCCRMTRFFEDMAAYDPAMVRRLGT
jgi:hypothetical protein